MVDSRGRTWQEKEGRGGRDAEKRRQNKRDWYQMNRQRERPKWRSKSIQQQPYHEDPAHERQRLVDQNSAFAQALLRAAEAQLEKIPQPKLPPSDALPVRIAAVPHRSGSGWQFE